MPLSLHELDGELTKLYSQQSIEYAQALEVLSYLSGVFTSGPHPDEPMQRLAEIMARVAEVERKLVPVKLAWEQSQPAASAELKTVVQCIRRQLEELVPLISRAEAEAQLAKDRLLPQLSDEARVRRMRHAYGEASSEV